MTTFGQMAKGVFSEDNGNLSSIRVLCALVVVIVLGTWSAFCLRNNTLVGFDVADVGLILGAFGAKAWQKTKETKT